MPIKRLRKLAEGFGPVYKDGKPAPGFEGLGPQKDPGKGRRMPSRPKPKKRTPIPPVRKPGTKRWFA